MYNSIRKVQVVYMRILNKYFSFISKLDEANAPLPDIELKTNNNITDLNVSVEEISDIIQILHPNKASDRMSSATKC